MPQPGFGQPTIVHGQGFRLHLGIEIKESQVGRYGGSRGAAEPGQLGLRVDFAGVEDGLVLKGLLERIPVFRNLESGSSRLATDLDVPGVSSNPLRDQKLIPDAEWFSGSNAWAVVRLPVLLLYCGKLSGFHLIHP